MDKCNCCGSILHQIEYKDQFLYNDLVFCTSCSHIQVQHIPTHEQLTSYYELQYSQNRKMFFNDAYKNIMKKRAVSQIYTIENCISIQDKTVCDIGCGYGFFLSSISDLTQKGIGYEYDPECVNHCNNLNLPVKKISNENQFYEMENNYLVILSHVLEHIANIGNFLDLVKDKSNYIFIEVPSYNRNCQEQFVDQEGHINFFNRISLERLLVNHGFEVMFCCRYGPSVSLFYKKNMRLIYKILKYVQKDYFLNLYNKKSKNGIWIRALVKSK